MNSFWRDRSVLVTGATGLLGSCLVPMLSDAGANVVCLVRDWVPQSDLVRTHRIEQVNTVRGDINDRDLIERALGEYEVEVVFHLAAQTIVGIANRNPVSTFSTNIGGTWNILEACRRSPRVTSIVVASSDKAYGEQEHLPYDETMPLQGRHPYDVSKSCADLIAQTYAATYDLPVAITRCGNFYGGGDLNWNRVVPGTIRSILRGERPVVRSDGKFVRDYFYIEDGAAAYMLLAERLTSYSALRGQAFNFSNESQISVLEIVDLILKKMNSSLRPEILNQASNEIRHQFLSAERARTMLNWHPQFTLDTGLDRTIAWYREFLGMPAAMCAGRQRITIMFKTPRPAARRNSRSRSAVLRRRICPATLRAGRKSMCRCRARSSTRPNWSIWSKPRSMDGSPPAVLPPSLSATLRRSWGCAARRSSIRDRPPIWLRSRASLLHRLATAACAPATKSSPWRRAFPPPSIRLFRMAWCRCLSTFSFPPTTSMSRNLKPPSPTARGRSSSRTHLAIRLISTQSWLSPTSTTSG